MKDAFDEALERLRGTGTEVAGGIAPNHGPMGAEALVALVATTPSSHGQIDTGETSISCPRPTRPLQKKRGGRVSELLSVSETGLFSFARNWLRTLGVPYLQSGSAVCCRRRLQQAPMASSAPRTPSARWSTPRRRCA